MRYTVVFAALLLAGAVIDSASSGQDHSKSKTWARAYRQAATEKEKRAVCIAMIDDEVKSCQTSSCSRYGFMPGNGEGIWHLLTLSLMRRRNELPGPGRVFTA